MKQKDQQRIKQHDETSQPHAKNIDKQNRTQQTLTKQKENAITETKNTTTKTQRYTH